MRCFHQCLLVNFFVSMKSGLEGRNNLTDMPPSNSHNSVSMKSGLEGRNNEPELSSSSPTVRVSMKSGLEGRNN